MRLVLPWVLVAAACSSSNAAPSPEPAEPIGALAAAGGEAMCVTLGEIGVGDGGPRIDAPKVRAVVPQAHGDAAELSFVYAGPTEETAPLASGQVRRQVGLKLRAADGCNLVYVMWRWGPGRPKLEVSVKRNRGDSAHAQCGAGGYDKLRAERQVRVPRPTYGSVHSLAARIEGDRLTARIDGVVVWEGSLPSVTRELRGPAGMRTDNVALEAVELRTARTRHPSTAPAGCRPGPTLSAERRPSKGAP